MALKATNLRLPRIFSKQQLHSRKSAKIIQYIQSLIHAPYSLRDSGLMLIY
jgi:hypothetical protein